jgi:hypothetical protein
LSGNSSEKLEVFSGEFEIGKKEVPFSFELKTKNERLKTAA